MEKVKRKVTYRLYPSSRHGQLLLDTLRLHQRLYNSALEQRISAYKYRKKSLNFYDQCKELTDLRKEMPEYNSINAQSCQVTLKRLDLAFTAFYRRLSLKDKKAGFPRFKSLDRFSGFGYKTAGDGWKLLPGKEQRHGLLRLSGIGHIKIRGKARIMGEAKTCEIYHKSGKWYASVTIACQPQRLCGSRALGIDWGLESFATISSDKGDIATIDNPRLLKKSLKHLIAKQQDLSRKKGGSNNRKKAKAFVAKIHSKVTNRRKDFLHQTTSRIIKSSALIAIEKLNIKNMSAHGGAYKRGLNREIVSAAPGMFHQMLKSKAEEAGVELIEIEPRAVKPSQTCSGCGHQEKKALNMRRHECACGTSLSRDANAARVILNWALFNNATGQELSRCGEMASAVSMKHETPSISAYIS